MKTITVREAYDWIYLEREAGHEKSLTKIEWEQVVQYFEKTYANEKVVEYGARRLRFLNMVGVVQLKTVRIEVLPKIDLDPVDQTVNRRALLTMLSETKKLPVRLSEQTVSQYEKVDLSHLLAFLYITELFKAAKRGIYRGYLSRTDNIKHLRGRLLVTPHIQKNATVPIRAYCEYDELSPDVPLNQVLKAALKVIFPYVRHSTLKTQSYLIYEMFDEVEDGFVHSSIAKKINWNRQNQHYEVAYELAQAILQSRFMSTGSSQQVAYSFLFKMNDLYEAYVGECLKRVLSLQEYRLDLQHKGKKLLIDHFTGRGVVPLQPDFVVSRWVDGEAVPLIILDTKWKNGQGSPAPSDTYQMYAYVTAYQTAERCILLYPRNDQGVAIQKWQVPGSTPVKYIELQTLRLDKIQHTVDDLREMLGV